MSRQIGDLVVLDERDVEGIHWDLVEYFETHERDPIRPSGVKDRNLLLSAIGRQEAGIDGRLFYGDPLSNATTLLYGLSENHPFQNGNKRTALVSFLSHLYLNDHIVRGMSHNELYEVVVALAKRDIAKFRTGNPRGKRGSSRRLADEARHTRLREEIGTREEIEIIVQRLRPFVERANRRTYPMSARSLKQILGRFGFEFGRVRNNQVELIRTRKALKRQGWWTPKTEVKIQETIGRIPDPGDARMISIHEIKRIREITGLTEEMGVDSESFFHGLEPVDELIAAHATILQRLARYDREGK